MLNEDVNVVPYLFKWHSIINYKSNLYIVMPCVIICFPAKLNKIFTICKFHQVLHKEYILSSISQVIKKLEEYLQINKIETKL
jgi:hypothetical protein